jgi:hypothetical protein
MDMIAIRKNKIKDLMDNKRDKPQATEMLGHGLISFFMQKSKESA